MTAKGNTRNSVDTICEFYGIADITNVDSYKSYGLDEEDADVLFEHLDSLNIAYDKDDFTIITDNESKSIRNRKESKTRKTNTWGKPDTDISVKEWQWKT